MNEELLKKVIQFKIDTAGKIISHLPPETTQKLKSYARFAVDRVGEMLSDEKGNKGTADGKVNSVKID